MAGTKDLQRAYIAGLFDGEFKIFNPIVCFIVVFVMDNLMGLKESTKMLFHHISMLPHITARSVRMIWGINHYISRMVSYPTLPFRSIFRISSLKYFMTIHTTKYMFSPFVTFVISKSFSTLITLKNTFTRLVVTISITKSSLLTRRGFEGFIADITSINHIGIL